MRASFSVKINTDTPEILQMLDFLPTFAAMKVIHVSGSWLEMGRQYGEQLSEQLRHVYAFLVEKGSTPERMQAIADVAEKLFSRYPEPLRLFLAGVASSSGLSEQQLRLINAVEYAEPVWLCSALAAWGDYANGPLVFGRNYDALSYQSLADDLVVTIFHPTGLLSVATIGYAGEIYAVNGFNEAGLFVELNNGMPSAGYDIRYDLPASTTTLLMMLFEARTIDDVDRFFRSTQSFSSLLIGVADAHEARSYEWCTAGMQRGDEGPEKGMMAQTNHYVHPAWPYPVPDDEKAWQSLTRRCHLCTLAERYKGQIDLPLMQQIMQTPIAEGGPMFADFTMYQLVVCPADRRLSLRVNPAGEWENIWL